MANAYSEGQGIRCSVIFRDIDGDNVDPATVRFRVRRPDGTVTVYVYLVDAQLVRDSVGHYHCDIVLDREGDWFYRWESETPHGAAETRVRVCASAIV